MRLFDIHRNLGTAAVGILLAGLSGGFFSSAVAADGPLAFDDRFRFRIALYDIQNADTDILVADTETNLGVAYSFRDDLGGEDSAAVPRFDAYYRFSDRHRIEFGVFEFERDGRANLEIEIDLDDEIFNVGDTLVSDINYELLKLAYAYSFYRSDRVEIAVSAGLNVTTYEFKYERGDGSRNESVDATGPLPMFGGRVSYAITPRWSLHYLNEAFYIAIEDTYEGSFTTSEIDIEYRFNKLFTLGAGITRFSTDLDADDPDWKGSISDTHVGLMLYAAFYL
ncbi:MAG: hypothetical protein PVI79_09030 [Gammaproteobacteria bacterium]